jgi:hypothetical protein
MPKATMLLAVAALALAPALGGCKKGSGDGNARCRVFDEDPVTAESGALAGLREAYDDAARIAECAKAAKMTVEEFMRAHRVAERLRSAKTILEGTAETVVEGAKATARQVEQGATRTLEAAQDKAWDTIRAVQEQAQ